MISSKPTPAQRSGRGYILRCRLIASLLGFWSIFVPQIVTAQFTNIQGTLIGQYELLRNEYTDAYSNYSTYRQLAMVSTSGYLYKPGLAEFNLRTQLANSNSLITNKLSESFQHDLIFNLYDLDVDILRNTRTPVFLFSRRDMSQTEVNTESLPTFSNRILTSSNGIRTSFSIKEKWPRIGLSYDKSDSRSLNDLVPLNYETSTVQATLDVPIASVVETGLEVLKRDRVDNISQVRYKTYEARLRGSFTPNDRNQIAANGNYWNEGSLSSANGNVMWNARYDGDINNQISSQMRWFDNPAIADVQVEIRDQIDIGINQAWRGLGILNVMRGATYGSKGVTPTQSASVTAGATHVRDFDRFQMNMQSQGTYLQSSSVADYRSIEGLFSGGLRTKGFWWGQVSLGEQLNVRRFSSYTSQTILQNSFSTIFETNAISMVSIRTSGSYLYSKELTESVYPYAERGAEVMLDVTYRWLNGISALITAHYGYNGMWGNYYSKLAHNYSATAILPDMMTHLTVQGRVGRTYEPTIGLNQFNYDVVVSYSWRAIACNVRLTGYSYLGINRNDVYVTISRPFRYDFE
jgi:hypothetical protein